VDGEAYALEDFLEEYGDVEGTQLWQQAVPAPAPAPVPAQLAVGQGQGSVVAGGGELQGASSSSSSSTMATELAALADQQVFRLMNFGFSRLKVTQAMAEQRGVREMADEDEVLGMLLGQVLARRRRRGGGGARGQGATAAAEAEAARQERLAAVVASVECEELDEMWAEEQVPPLALRSSHLVICCAQARPMLRAPRVCVGRARLRKRWPPSSPTTFARWGEGDARWCCAVRWETAPQGTARARSPRAAAAVAAAGRKSRRSRR
jgi:hypothetical protein